MREEIAFANRAAVRQELPVELLENGSGKMT
jgi:hypothetical protein